MERTRYTTSHAQVTSKISSPMASPGSRPTERLLPQTLVAIFQIVQAIWEPHWSLDTCEPYDRFGWVVLSHVCQRWRTVLLNMPLLWTSIRFAPNGWVETYMTRSHDAGLRIAMHYPFDDLGRQQFLQQHVLQKVIPRLARLEVFELEGLVHKFLQLAIDHPVPKLSKLVLIPSKSHVHCGIVPDFIIPSTLFAGNVPSLRHLDLSDLPVSPSSPLLSANLTTLRLRRRQGQHTSCPRFLSLPNLIEVLVRMPGLEEFTMHDVLTRPEDTLPEALRCNERLKLCHLQRLQFHTPWIANYRWFMQTLDHDNRSPVRNIDMGTSVTKEIVEHGVGLTLISQKETIRLSEIEVCSNMPKSFKLSGWSRWHTEDEQPAQEDERRVGFSATIELEDVSIADGISSLAIASKLLLDRVESLRISRNDNPRARSAGAVLLRMLPGLKSITADQCSGHDCRDIADAPTTHTDISGNIDFPCPHLRRLDFPHVTAEDNRTGRAEFFASLADALDKRYRHGLKIEELRIGDRMILCNVPGDFRALRSRVKQEIEFGGEVL